MGRHARASEYPAADGATGAAPSVQRVALDACVDVIAGVEPGIAEIPAHETLITTRWLHPALHETMPEVPVHVVATYYGAPVKRAWRCGNFRREAVGRPGTTAVIPAHWGGRWDIEQEGRLSYVFLSNARLKSFAEQWLPGGKAIELVPSIGEEDAIGSHIMRLLNRYASRPDQASSLLAEQALDHLCLHLIRNHSSLAKPAAPVPARGLLAWQVRKVTGYMRDRLDRTIGLDELAAELNLSRFHFCTAFRLATGRTPYEWLIQMRIERARELLADPRHSITDIALAVGYRTPSAFAASFRKVAGTTPSEFRRGL
jgi:AraC family transcriptional regulator